MADQGPEVALTQDVLQRAVQTAVRAPSVHNTQPWLFTAHGNDVLLHADTSRWLRDEDPQQRELHISCGAALQHLSLGLRAQGLAVTHALVPDPGDPALLGRVAVVGHEPLSDAESRLLEAVSTRHTDRSRYVDRPVPEDVVTQLRRVVEASGCFLDVLADDDVLALAVLTDHGEQSRAHDPARQAEQDRWVSGADQEQGVPGESVTHRASSVPLRGFVAAEAGRSDPPPPAEHPLWCVLGSDTDDRRSWVASGWALAELLLTLESLGLVGSPLTQALEFEGLRARLRAELGLTGHPQMVLRIGYPSGPGSARTGRRPVDDVLR